MILEPEIGGVLLYMIVVAGAQLCLQENDMGDLEKRVGIRYSKSRGVLDG